MVTRMAPKSMLDHESKHAEVPTKLSHYEASPLDSCDPPMLQLLQNPVTALSRHA